MIKLEIQNNKAPYLFRYRTDNTNTLDELRNNYIYFPSNEKLNDPFDANSEMLEISKDGAELQKFYDLMLSQILDINSRKYFQETFKNNPLDLYHYVNNNKKNFIANFGIACFTMSEINLLLWATYANNHQGLCIQYNVKFDLDFFNGIRKVEYFDKFEKINYLLATNQGAFQDVFFRKFSLWEKEFEYRLIKINTGKYEHNPLAIRNIIFGFRAKDEFKSQVIEIVKNKYPHVKLYQPILFKESFEVAFQELII